MPKSKDSSDGKEARAEKSARKKAEKREKALNKKRKAARKKALKAKAKAEKKARKAFQKTEKERLKRTARYVKSCSFATHKMVEAAKSGWTPNVEHCLTKGALVNEKDGGTTALMGAAKWGHVEVLHVLFSAGANPDLMSGEAQGGCTALHFAVGSNELAAVQVYLMPLPILMLPH